MRKLILRSSFVVVSALLAVGVTACGAAEEQFDPELARYPLTFTGYWVYDYGTQCTVGGATMHCCPSGYGMIGAHIGNNVFRCAQLTGWGSNSFIDVGTARNGMHACPFGSMMVGLNVGSNYLACRYPSPSVSWEYVDGSTVDSYPMHVCPPSYYGMTGINVGSNLFNCGQ